MDKDAYAIATSGGACAASFLFFDCSNGEIEKTVDYVCECAVYARSHWRNPFKILQYLEGAIDRFIGARGAALTGNLEVSVTTLPWLRNARVTRFDDGPGAMRAAILASSCATPYTPVWLPALSSWCIDGAVSDVKLVRGMLLGRRFTSLHQDDAVSVCPFYFSRADVAPSRFVPPWWSAVPPPPAKLRALYDLGYRDAVRWLARAGRLPREPPPGPDVPRWWTLAHTPPRRGRGASPGPARAGRAAWRRAHPALAVAASAAAAVAWAAIAVELFASALACWVAVLAAPLLGDVPLADAWARFVGAVAGAAPAAPALALGAAVPGGPRAVGGAVAARPGLAARLREHSAIYRFLRFALH